MKFSVKFALSALFALALALPCFAEGLFGPDIEVVDQAYVKEHVGQPGVVLVDVRVPEVFNGKSPREGIPGGHIPGAVDFPLDDLKKDDAAAALEKAGITKDSEIIAYCNSGKMSGQFAEALVKDFDFDEKKVKNYKGSVIDWAENPDNKLEPEDHE